MNQAATDFADELSKSTRRETAAAIFANELSKSTRRETAATAAVQRQKKPEKAALPSIKDNPFAQIAMSTPDPQAQKDAMTELLVFKDAATTAKNAAALAEYCAYMQANRQNLAVDLIEMTDTEAFANTQRVLVDINNGVLDFQEQIKPLVDILNAVRQIQAEDATTDILAEMREDKKLQSELQANLGRIADEIEALRETINANRVSIELSKEDRRLFGYGGITKSAQENIARLQIANESLGAKITELEQQRDTLRAEFRQAASKFEHLREAKEVLGKLLDLSQEDHIERHAKLVQTASSFVTTTKARVDDTLQHSVKMGAQITSLSNTAFSMRHSYSVIASATKAAEKINADAHNKLRAELEATEDQLAKMELEKTSREMSKHITTLNDTAAETTHVISDLTFSSQRIETMEAANVAQIKKTQQIQTAGIAGVADNLSSVLTAINQAAIGQASVAAQQSLRKMNIITDDLTKEQMLGAAKARADDNSQMIVALEQLASYGEIITLANESAYQAVEEQRELLEQMRESADAVNQSAAETLEVAARTISKEFSQAN